MGMTQGASRGGWEVTECLLSLSVWSWVTGPQSSAGCRQGWQLNPFWVPTYNLPLSGEAGFSHSNNHPVRPMWDPLLLISGERQVRSGEDNWSALRKIEELCCSRCGPGTSSIRGLVRNADSQAPPHPIPTESELEFEHIWGYQQGCIPSGGSTGKIPFLAFSSFKGHLNSLALDSLLYLQKQQNIQENLRALIQWAASRLTLFQSLVLSFTVLNIHSCSFNRYSVGTYLMPDIVLDSRDNLAQSRSQRALEQCMFQRNGSQGRGHSQSSGADVSLAAFREMPRAIFPCRYLSPCCWMAEYNEQLWLQVLELVPCIL